MNSASDMFGALAKELYKNPLIETIRNSNIEEYDIHAAHLMAIKLIEGDDLYNSLCTMPKLERNIEIGKMQINNKSLSRKLQDYLFLFKKEFILKNKIKRSEIIETTKDSITLLNKIPTVTKININGTEIEFNNKDGVFTTYYRINNKSIYFDAITKKIRIKGINDDIIQNSSFINDYFIPLLITFEAIKNMTSGLILKNIKLYRLKYITNDNKNIYRSIDYDNKFLYDINNEVVESDVYIPNKEHDLIQIDNYKNYVLPLFNTVL